MNDVKSIVSQMTLNEKAGLCSGADCWNTKAVERLGVPSIMVSDGPHGLRKQDNSQDNLGIGSSVPATCFPTASLLACSFDRELIYKVGQSIAEECVDNNVQVLLGPGINIKRNPLCGRNFEYYSEDPYVSGEMGKAFVNGVQSMGIGTSLKHFAVNNQERRRMNVSAEIDERTLFEIYLRAFEEVVKEAKPYTVMCSYNKINGVYSSENKELLTNILREKWGYKGLVVSDWGAVNKRVDGVEAGLDLEMPASGGCNDKKIIDAVNAGTLSEEALDKAAINAVELALKCKFNSEIKSVDKSHHDYAVYAAEQSMVLLKNENNLLPINSSFSPDSHNSKKRKITIIGSMAKKPRYQGAGSSKINPIKIDCPYDELADIFNNTDIELCFSEGYSSDNTKNCTNNDSILLEEAINTAKSSDVVIIFAGLTERYESEGFDRKDMSMPDNQNRLISEISKINSNIIVVLAGGAPISIPWEKDVQAILLAYLGGEGSGKAIAGILSGKVCPSGKLAETWPYKESDVLSNHYFPGDRLNVQYREGLFVGYRYFNSVNKPVMYPFGYGLSYADIKYSDFSVDKENITVNDVNDYNTELSFALNLSNLSDIECKETVFLFVEHKGRRVVMPKYCLCGFDKFSLSGKEDKTVNIKVKLKDLGFYNTSTDRFDVESGQYIIYAAKNINDFILSVKINIENKIDNIFTNNNINHTDKNYLDATAYSRIDSGIDVNEISDDDFEHLIGHDISKPAPKPSRPFTMDDSLEDTVVTVPGRIIYNLFTFAMKKMSSVEEGQDQMMIATVKEMPFHSLWSSSEGMISEGMMEGILTIINGHFFKGLHMIISHSHN